MLVTLSNGQTIELDISEETYENLINNIAALLSDPTGYIALDKSCVKMIDLPKITNVKPEEFIMKFCETCNAPIPQLKRSGRYRTYCSDECKKPVNKYRIVK